MAGGLLNLIAIGNQNIILTGNPSKSFFKSKYVKYTNFGLQKFRVDQTGNQELQIDKLTTISFKIPRYGDLLMDTYLAITLPNIWSPIYHYTSEDFSLNYPLTSQTISGEYRPYEFQWIKNIGTQLITEVQFTFNGRLIQKYSGSYIQNVVERDFDANKKELFNLMSGNTSYLNDPANYANRNNNYPNAFNYKNTIDPSGIEPSIRQTQLYIPINSWYSMASTMALPLICLQYDVLEIKFILRPISQLFTIKDVLYDVSANTENIYPLTYSEFPRIFPDQSKKEQYGYYRFIQEPPTRDISFGYKYVDKTMKFNGNIHLITTQCFLGDEERRLFANGKQEYLIKLVYETKKELKQQSGKITFDSNGLVSSWMWYLQRDDIKERNEWSNYTNWQYENKEPNNLQLLDISNNGFIYYNSHIKNTSEYNLTTRLVEELQQISDLSKNIYITGNVPDDFSEKNHKNILTKFAIIVDGKYREDDYPSELYSQIEKYNTSNGYSKEGLYCYNFALSTDPYKYQPNGAFNTNKFKTIEFEYNIAINPPLERDKVEFRTICDPETGVVIATSKDPGSIYKYNYDLYIIEERYNILKFQSGTADLEYSR
jgi:hypothetical protein